MVEIIFKITDGCNYFVRLLRVADGEICLLGRDIHLSIIYRNIL